MRTGYRQYFYNRVTFKMPHRNRNIILPIHVTRGSDHVPFDKHVATFVELKPCGPFSVQLYPILLPVVNTFPICIDPETDGGNPQSDNGIES